MMLKSTVARLFFWKPPLRAVFVSRGEIVNEKFFIVNLAGYILPMQYDTYELACESCDINETVYLADSLEDLEYSLEIVEEDP